MTLFKPSVHVSEALFTHLVDTHTLGHDDHALRLLWDRQQGQQLQQLGRKQLVTINTFEARARDSYTVLEGCKASKTVP